MKHERKNTNRRKFKLPFSAVLMYLLLITIVLSGVTFSKYVTDTTVGDTARVSYMRDISISETGNFTELNKWIILPGVNMQKNATVKFEGSEMACYVFLRITANGWEKKSDNYSYACPIDGTDALFWSVDTDWWTFLTDDTDGAVYYRIVSANTEFNANVLANEGTITVSDSLTRTQLGKLTADMSIDIGATAVQYHGLSEDSDYTEQDRAKAAWNLVKSR